MSVITTERMERIRSKSLDRLTAHFPEARFVDDTELVLDPDRGAVASLNTLLTIISKNDECYEEEILDDYWGTLLPALLESCEAEGDRLQLDRRRVLAGITKMIYPINSQPEFVDGIPLTRDLMIVYALRENDAIRLMPLSHFTDVVDLEILDAAANAKIKAYSRGLEIIREMGGVIIHGRKQTPSIALVIDACTKNLKLTPCEHGYFVAMPTREHLAIIPATRADMFMPLVELTLGTFQGGDQPLVPWIYHVQDGHFEEVLGPEGVDLTDELLSLHGPFEEWPHAEDYWDTAYPE